MKLHAHRSSKTSPETVHVISAQELKYAIDHGEPIKLLDVREPHETAEEIIPGATCIPLGELQRQAPTLDPKENIVAYCKIGVRSARAAQLLQEYGFSNVRNLTGGILIWHKQITR